MPSWLRDALASISLANLCFLAPWLILLNPNHYPYYYWKSDPGYSESISLVVLVLLLGILFWSLRRFARHRVGRWVFLLLLAWPINSFLIDYLRLSVFDNALKSNWRLLTLVAVLGVLTYMCVRYQKRVVALVPFALVLLSPLILVNTAVALWLRHKQPPVAEAHRREQQVGPAHEAAQRVVWIIFDELQVQSVFENRRNGLHLPEFDQFASKSLVLTNAYPPSWQTLTSMPALISGQFLRSTVPINANEAQLQAEDGTSVQWSKQSSVFSEAKQEGFTTGLAGWYHPYCRVIGNALDLCQWSPQVSQTNPAFGRLTFGDALLNNLTTAVLRIPFVFRLFHRIYETKQRNDHARALAEIASNANEIVNHKLDLTLIHFPVPHSPWINEPVVNPESLDGYTSNAMIADRTLGELRQSMADEWDKSVVLVSSDHWWRDAPLTNGKRDHRIPFMLKLADQKQGVEYKGSFNTVLTRELLLHLLRGEMKKASEVVEWIERNSRLGESPLTVNAP